MLFITYHVTESGEGFREGYFFFSGTVHIHWQKQIPDKYHKEGQKNHHQIEAVLE